MCLDKFSSSLEENLDELFDLDIRVTLISDDITTLPSQRITDTDDCTTGSCH